MILTLVSSAVLATEPPAWPARHSPPPPSLAPSIELTLNGSSGSSELFADSVDPILQTRCVVCHEQGGTAEANGARLVLSNSTENNELAIQQFATVLESPAFLLSKVSGGLNHGGGIVLSQGSLQYTALEQYLDTLTGTSSSSEQESAKFWEGISLETRETTLRRASLLLSGRVATPDSIDRAKRSDEALSAELLSLMEGPGFHDFLITGAGDRLLTQGITRGVDVDHDFTARYPAWSEARDKLGTERPSDFDTDEKQFLHRNAGSIEFAWAMSQEPLELIAHIVMSDKPYSEILTADYTMVNVLTDIAYRSDAGFDSPLVDPQGLYHPPDFGQFLPGKNNGHIPHDEAWRFDGERQVVTAFSDYHTMPHAGVLSTPGWLIRYPSTETNRNRARARWTYLHFLGVDIEKSAQRSTDPEALADLDNPTMNNGACTVCHERLDPMAGAYQSFGNTGHYLDKGNGAHTLPDTYTCPGCSDFQVGDTWYRDMRGPGFEGSHASTGQNLDSLQWLAQQIVNDARFPEATVRFWWPAVFGAEALKPPERDDIPYYDAHIAAYNAQQTLIADLAGQFIASGFNAKSLLANMLTSRWYRAAHDTTEQSTARDIELATLGSGRLLTPAELDRKNRAVFGRSWQQWLDGYGSLSNRYKSALRWSPRGSFNIFLGGINGANVNLRNRQMSPLMANVTQIMALDLSCQIVLEEFQKPAAQRVAFKAVEPSTDFSTAANETAVEEQLRALLLRAHNRPASEQEIEGLLNTMRQYAEKEAAASESFDASESCSLGEVWGHQIEDAIWRDATSDPTGMKRAWSMIVHGVLNSFWYLHD